MAKSNAPKRAQLTRLRRQLRSARQAHAKGMMCTEDYIRIALQCYTAESAETVVQREHVLQ